MNAVERTFSAQAESDVRAAYQWILGRQADAGGLSDYATAIDRGDIDNARLRELFFESQEFKGQNRRGRCVVDIGNGLKAVVDPKDPEFGRFIAQHGHWELHIVDAIRSSLATGDTFIDVGANLGLMSFNAAQVVGANGRVIGFEPNPQNVANYWRGMAANGFENVLLYPFGVSDTFRTITTSRASNAKVIDDNDPLTGHDVVQAVPADHFLQHEARVDFVKMDIEGYELPALIGMDATLRRHSPVVLMEFNPLCLSAFGATGVADLAAHVFSMTESVDIVEHDHSRTPVKSADELMDLWGRRDKQISDAGILPVGWVHFDLLFGAYR